MSEFHFIVGSGKGKISSSTYKKVCKICKNYDVTFVAEKLPGEGYKHWFSARNYGSPFDQATAKAVTNALSQANIILP